MRCSLLSTCDRPNSTQNPTPRLDAATPPAQVFDLFKAFVARHRPQLDIEQVATGETWFGEDAVARNLTDALQVRRLPLP